MSVTLSSLVVTRRVFSSVDYSGAAVSRSDGGGTAIRGSRLLRIFGLQD